MHKANQKEYKPRFPVVLCTLQAIYVSPRTLATPTVNDFDYRDHCFWFMMPIRVLFRFALNSL
jgi:hypothetical protein